MNVEEERRWNEMLVVPGTRFILVLSFWSFEITCYFFFFWTAWPFRKGPVGRPETSVANHQSTLRSITEERMSPPSWLKPVTHAIEKWGSRNDKIARGEDWKIKQKCWEKASVHFNKQTKIKKMQMECRIERKEINLKGMRGVIKDMSQRGWSEPVQHGVR